jgi:outer membrane receptor protein involved in Fe transport
VWQPAYVEGLSVSVDWYDIEIDDGIATTPRTVVMARCFEVDPAQFDPTCGARAERDPTPGAGALIAVDSASSNENRFETSGIDLQARYRLAIGPGELNAGVFYNYLLNFDTIGIVDGDLDEDAGEVLYPKNRAVLNLGYALGDWQFSWRARYWDRVKDSNTPELTNENSDVFGNPLHPSKNEIPSYVYHDASIGFERNRYSVRAGVNNVFDKQPPLLTQISQYGNTGTNIAAEAYDAIGRAWYLSFNYRIE